MDLIHSFLNLIVPPFSFFSLCLFLPPYIFFKCFLYMFNTLFKENVEGKVVLITGASSGIGEHLAYEYARRGACLALVARRERRLIEVVETAREMGSRDVLMIVADVQDVNDCRRIVEETVNYFGRLDHLVNNAGISGVALLEEIVDITKFRPVMDTNFWGSAYITHFAIPHLKDTRGKILAISSCDSWLPRPRTSIYNASKAAMFNFFDTLRVELGSDVHVLIVTPGFIESEMTQGKFLKEGGIEVDQDLRDVELSAVQVETTHRCAKAIVNSACRGDKYLTEPVWFNITWVWKMFCPDVIEWFFRLFYLSRAGVEPATEAPSKKILDVTGAKKILYPETIHTAEIESE